jgi:hypothetical protein
MVCGGCPGASPLWGLRDVWPWHALLTIRPPEAGAVSIHSLHCHWSSFLFMENVAFLLEPGWPEFWWIVAHLPWKA